MGVPDELQVADALTKDKTDKVGLTEMMVHGQLKATQCRTNLIYHSGKDFRIVGEALRSRGQGDTERDEGRVQGFGWGWGS